MESSYYVEEESCIADETAESYIDLERQQCHAPSFQPSTMSDQGKAVYGIAVYPQPPKKQRAQPQVFCCEPCGISCVGPQQYAEHLNGQKHKKTEVSQAYCCDLCAISCLGSQQYADHLNGKKHKKTKISQALYCKEDVSFAVNPLCSERFDVFCSSAQAFAAHVDLHTMTGKTAPTVTMPQASQNSADADASIPSSSSTSPSPASALALTAGEKPEAESMSVPPSTIASDTAAERVDDETAADSRDIVAEKFIEEMRSEEPLCDVFCSSVQTFAAHVDLNTMMGKTAPTVTMPQAAQNSADTDTSIPSSSSASPSPASALALTAGEKPEAESMSVPPSTIASDAAAERVGDETAADSRDIVAEKFIEEMRNEEPLCDVFCSSVQTFAAHVDLNTMMGKTAPTVTMPQAAQNSADTDTSIPSSSSASPSPASALALTAGEKSEAEIMSVPPTAVASDAAAEKVGSDKTAAYASDNVGDEFIEEVRNEKGLVVIYYCKLCECSLTNPNARRVHLTGRRHRIQYKKKIDHIVGVDVGRRVTTIDDRYMIDKHMELYPPKEEMAEIHIAIFALEHALKLISDFIAAEDAPSKKTNPVETSEATAVQSSVGPEKTAEKMASDELCQDADIEMMETTATEVADRGAAHLIKGSMKVGLLSKGLLLREDRLAEHFVVLCSEIPTRSLLQRIVEHLRAQLEIVSPWKKFNVETRFEEAGIFVTIEKPAVSFAVTLTSMLIGKDHKQVDPRPSVPSDQLSPRCCLSALSLLRHTRFFQVHLCAMKEGAVVAHVLRDLCRRNATWTPLTEWAQMLLVEKGISAAGIDIGPGEALRSFFACISSGILLPGGHGLMDPCEKVLTDVTAYLTPQQCEDITASAQQFMRLLVFHQLHKILCVARFKGSEFKRRRDWDDKPERADDKKFKQKTLPSTKNGAACEDLPVTATD